MDSTIAPPSKTTRERSASPLPSKGEDAVDSSQSVVGTDEIVRPVIKYDSPSVFFKTFWARFASIWTKRFVLSLLAGQLVSLCITCTNVTTTELVNRGWALPTTQTFFLYFSLFITYTPYTIYKYGFVGWGKLILRDGWKYFILAACDVEGNFLVVKAYQYTDLLSCMLLDAWAIPSCMFFCWVFMRRQYAWSQLAGILICVGGLGMLVGSDHLTDKSWEAVDKVKGDLFMIAGATLYGFTNAAEEFFVRQSPLYEVVGQLGMWGTLINGVQAAALEHRDMTTATWNGAIGGILVAYTAAMFILYTTAPILYRMATSVFYNLSLLSSDFFGLLFGLFLFHYAPFWLYFVAFAIIICGLICYFWSTTPESEGKVDPQKPSYIKERDDEQTAPENQA
jgi:solute carrier family 35 protein F1/2